MNVKQCRMINNSIHPDLYIVEKEEGKKEITKDKIGDAKNDNGLIFNLRNSILSGKYKICIIKDANFLNKSAANSLLKSFRGTSRIYIIFPYN